ncbi:MAG TPA: hypothetical protein VFE85_09080 [Woeseiaceae bacterium]|nr:hypothetical protein [Woeseiaceae bacterium]
MLQTLDTHRAPPAAPARRPSLARELRALGVQPRLLEGGHGVTAGGAALRLPLGEVLASPERAAHLFGRLRNLLLQRIPVTLTLTDLGAGGRARAALQCIGQRLGAVLATPCVDRRRLGLAVQASELSLPALQLMSRTLLGRGARFLLLDDVHLRTAGESAGDAGTAAIWSGLYQQRDRLSGVLPVYGGGVRSRCPLLGDEASGALLPQRALLVPPDSAWLPLDVHLPRFAAAGGALDAARLEAALRRALAVADRLFDRLCWPDHAQRNDAYLNRRIAVTLHGIGDLVELQRGDPGDLDCLRHWDRLLARLHRCLWDASRELAHERGLLPALACRNPALRWRDGAHRRDWQQRWQNALRTDAVRHRNLLVLSPYGILPRAAARPTRYADLLPLLAHADALSFAGAATFAGWRLREFRQFHCRAFAVMQRRNAAAFIAAGA